MFLHSFYGELFKKQSKCRTVNPSEEKGVLWEGCLFLKSNFIGVVPLFNGVMAWIERALALYQGKSNTWPPPSPSLDARSASWEEECVPSANRGTDCLGETECVSGWDVLGLHVRVSS